jgi:hypothetical protein
LESELRQPASSSSLEALVKEKDNQIRKVHLLPTFCQHISALLSQLMH